MSGLFFSMTMKKKFAVTYSPGGEVETIYQDGVANALKAEVRQVIRASNVEFEHSAGKSGWSVRAAHHHELALREGTYFGLPHIQFSPFGIIVLFPTREEALDAEVKHFQELAIDRKFHEDYEKHPCLLHDITGCMWCRYAEGPGEPPRVKR